MAASPVAPPPAAATPAAPSVLDASPAPLTLTGQVLRRGAELQISWRLAGALEGVCLPAPAPVPQRRDGLWQTTCLEFFLASPGADAYWEVNLSPAGHWNVYCLSGYRQGMAPETALQALPCRVTRTPGVLQLDLTCNLTALLPGGGPLELAITAVLEQAGGALSYWALAHPGSAPDFHRRDGFQLRL